MDNNKDVIEVFPKGSEIDITDLEYLYYRCFDKENVKIYSPQTLFCGEDGHRVKDSYGNEHFIPKDKFFHLKAKRKGESRPREVIVG